MNKILYIGQYSIGTTSKFRADNLRKILCPKSFEVIDTNIPFLKINKVWRSIGFRFKLGKVITDINEFVISNVDNEFDLIWVDKAIFLTLRTTVLLKNRTKFLIHYTPDTAFFHNSSNLFFNSLPFYDFVITTKSFDLLNYRKYIDSKKIYLINQGFDKTIHFPKVEFNRKGDYVLFIGLYEPFRAEIILNLLKNGIPVRLGGKKWKSFLNKNKINNLTYLGESILNENYSLEISKAKIALGLVSKRFPELHTTRTFEIPACGTALVTERNLEVTSFYSEDEVIFFENKTELVEKIKFYLNNNNSLKDLTLKGLKKVQSDGHDYETQFNHLLKNILNR